MTAPSCSVELIVQALREVPRDAFLTTGLPALTPLVSQNCPRPEAVQQLMEAARIQIGERVLQIGTGSGYVAAAAALIARSVITIERLAPLADLARHKCEALGYLNVEVYHDNGRYGWPNGAPYDVILINARKVAASPGLLRQLSVGGRLVAATGRNQGGQTTLYRVTRTGPNQYREDDLELAPLQDGVHELVALPNVTLVDSGETSADPPVAVRIPESNLLRLAAAQRRLRVAGIDEITDELDISVFNSVPRAFLQRHQMIPIDRRGNTVRVTSCNPDASVEEIRAAFPKCHVDLQLITASDFRLLWATCELRIAEAHASSVASESRRAEPAEQPYETDAYFCKLFETILVDAVKHRASDIHFERYGTEVRLRLRIDGELQHNRRFRLSTTEACGLVNVLKIRASMDIAERRLPQSGSLHVRVDGAPHDLRVQTQPSLHGEHAVIRLLPQNSGLMTINDLGFSPELAAIYARLLQVPSGMLLVVGPTGSGKSTTLYAGLQTLARNTARKVITIEDPIEYSVLGIQQAQVRPNIGFTFAQAMRSFLRLDPDVILLGEIRDTESALEAIRASQTGHLVLSTLHSNDTVDAVQRLFDLQMSPNSVASELRAVLAQRLAKRLCMNCRIDAVPAPSQIAEIFPRGTPPGFRCMVGAGCETCGGSGTNGRIAIYELLRATPELRRAISAGAGVDELRAMALRSGLVSLRSSLLAHVHAGLVDLADARRLLQPEQMMDPSV